jgi:hypothetical protein
MERIVITALYVSEQQISPVMDGVVMTVWAVLYTHNILYRFRV